MKILQLTYQVPPDDTPTSSPAVCSSPILPRTTTKPRAVDHIVQLFVYKQSLFGKAVFNS